jgi:hypothetical protein
MRKLKPCNDKNWPAYFSLKEHNDSIVSAESRATHIARAFLRGIPFSQLEQIKETPDARQALAIKRAKAIVEKYHTPDCKVLKSTFNEWLTR